MSVAAYIVIYLLIGMFLLVIGTWIFLAKMDFQAQAESTIWKTAPGVTKAFKLIGYFVAAASCIAAVFVGSAYMYTIINQSHSDVWLKNRSLVHRQILIEMSILIILNCILGFVFKQDRWLRRVYWICSGLLLSLVLIHGVISFIYGQSPLI